MPSFRQSFAHAKCCSPKGLIMESVCVSSYFASPPVVQAVSKNLVLLQSVDLDNLDIGLDLIGENIIGPCLTFLFNL
jgi:hypothetical protein